MRDETSRSVPDAGNRYFISASAGTGKTTRLLQDVMIDLLERSRDDRGNPDPGASIRQSLIVTFTIAASEELRSKLDANLRFAIDYAKTAEQWLRAPEDHPEPCDGGFRIGGDKGDLALMIRRSPADARFAQTVFSKALDELPAVQISSIDALNKYVVDRNADMLGIDPGYAIMADTAMLGQLRGRVLDDLFEQWYDPDFSRSDIMLGDRTVTVDHAAFLDLLDNVGGPQEDDKLRVEMLGLYDQAESKPEGMAWLDDLSSLYRTGFADRRPLQGANPLIDRAVDDWRSRVEAAGRQVADYLRALETGHSGHRTADELMAFPDQMFKPLFDVIDRGIAAYETGTWDEFRAALLPAKSMPKQILKTTIASGELFPWLDKESESAADGRELLRTIKKLASEPLSWCDRPAVQVDAVDVVAARRIDTLAALVRLFDEAYTAEKRRMKVAEFSDVTHWCAKALGVERDPTIDPKAVDAAVGRLAGQWRYVYVDECQDNNAVQNAIIDRIGERAVKVTMVGDIKQSIYAFRYARPDEFQRKNDEVALSAPEHMRVLEENHRSVPEILHFVNTVFDRLMRRDMGGADYTPLDGGRDSGTGVASHRFRILPPKVEEGEPPYGYHPDAVELLVRTKLDAGSGPDDEGGDGGAVIPRVATGQQQVDMIVRRIRSLIGTPIPGDRDGKRYSAGDIAVLARSKGLFGELHDALVRAGIPVEVDGVGDFYAKPEILIALDWLRVIDDPHMDTPMVALLRANGFTDQDLASMRAADRDGDGRPLRSGFLELLEKNRDRRDVAGFLNLLESLRAYAATHPVDELLWHVYGRTRWHEYCGLLPDGANRQANLAQLAGKARAFADAGERGVRAFLDAADRWAESKDSQVSEETGALATRDAVHVTTIHRSKGLQWKAVILMDAQSNPVNERNRAKFEVLSSAKLGDAADRALAACDLVDTAHQVKVATFQRALLVGEERREDIGEQLRLLYVALTRAEKKLIIAGTWTPKHGKDDPDDDSGIADLGSFCGKMTISADDPDRVDPGWVAGGSVSYLAWILAALRLAAEHTPDLDPGTLFNPADPECAGGTDTWRVRMPSDLGHDPVVAGLPGEHAFTVVSDHEPIDVTSVTRADAEGMEYADMRPSAERFLDPEADLPERHPATVNASGIRDWIQDTRTVPDTTDEAVVSTEADDIDDQTDERDTDGQGAHDADRLETGEHDVDGRRFSSLPLPDFMAGEGAGLTASELGTAVHNVLELFDWSVPADRDLCAGELRRVIRLLDERGVISHAAAERIGSSRLFAGMLWFTSGTGEGVGRLSDGIRRHRDRLFREAPFALLATADQARILMGETPTGKDDEDERVVRGVIDGYYVDDEHRRIVLFDYKTDRVRREERQDDEFGLEQWEERLHDEYYGQQALYAQALADLYPGYKVTRRWLVGLSGHRLIDVTR
ncbi:UvrD-helicase domain-containing protein [Bifidobacterium sp. SO4]|uniref:UvrD-helicase domain-containing protein n=1 Tax=Bifidobacterium sp. SO4 TaxID=2809030 RepID=UPI001BDDC8D4|nr:UvrD-helicase domain-containing protein [Bifidobacterium sp. SO4]MBT1171232.1 UvrD-helicase domain-containing protein [Bifidobacterium sp. SO4]